MESEDTGQDNPSRMPVATSCIPPGFITASSGWTSNSRAGVVLDFNPPTITSTMPTKDVSHAHTNSGQEVNLLPKHEQLDVNSKHEPLSENINTEPHTDYDAGDNFPGVLPQFFNKEFQGTLASPKLDTSMDVLEQQTSKEQAKLLQRFKQLKQWQQEQQEKLLRQRKDQLEQFKNEQERVKSMIALQRQMQWGGSSSQSSQKPAQLSSHNPSTIPHILANAASGGAKGFFPPVQEDASHLYPAQPSFPSSSLPVEDAQEECEFDSASDDIQSSTMMDGVEPLPDTASEFSDMPSEDKHTKEQTVVTSSDNERNLNKKLEVSKEAEFDEIPISVGSAGGRIKTFEELLEEQLQLESQSKEVKSVDTRSRKPFLRKGQGIARYGLAEKNPQISPQTASTAKVQDTAIKRDSNEKKSTAKSDHELHKKRNGPVDQPTSPPRKTKQSQNSSPKVSRKVASKPHQDEDHVFKHPLPFKLKLVPENKVKNAAISRSKDDYISQETASNHNDTMEVSFQNRMMVLEQQAEVEQDELQEFELLEQATDDMSFSSNSSMVVRMINKQKKWTPPTIHERRDREDLGNTGHDDRGSSTEEENEYEDNDRTLEQEENSSSSHKRPSSHELSVDFNDDESWGDFSHDLKDSEEEEEEEDEEEEEEDSYHDNAKQEESNIAGSENLVTSTPPLRKLASSAITKETLRDSGSTPPTSGLMTKLFPQLKPVESKESQHIHQQTQQLQHVNERAYNDGIQSKVLKEKLAELESEIERFRRENANLLKLRDERDKAMKQLQKEMRDFDMLKTEELQRLEEFKDEEMKKLKREKKTFEKYQKSARAIPDKKEREEIETLKKQLCEVQDEMRRKEMRWNSSSTRLHTRIENLEKDNHELRDELQILERRRLDTWKRDEESKSKKKKVPTATLR